MRRARVFAILPLGWFYSGARATALGKAFSRFYVAWASLGLPPRRLMGLEVTGRRSGRPRRLAVVVTRHEGQLYLVSMLGECEWVKNVRAGGRTRLISGRPRDVVLEEVLVGDHAPIIKEYLRLASGGRPHIGLDKTATLEDCERVAPGYPVFRVVYEDSGTHVAGSVHQRTG
jgi:deazaflavin-dependent oxidoreductase (nitroreductase family)